ncbi:MAG TPA: cytochrome c [Stellaceae bacterium]|nr:cytochrome c [Stellaceae bacterium]
MRCRWCIAAGIALMVGAPAVALSGAYNVAATSEHTFPVYWLLHATMAQSVWLHSRGIEPPALDDPAEIERGLALYRDNCAQCHGAPGVEPHAFALGLNPAPQNLVEPARRWTSAEIYWTVRHGVKMTGMPSWEARMSDQDLWSIVAFLKQLPQMSPTDYRSRAGQLSAVNPDKP